MYFGIIPPAVPEFRAAFGVPDDFEPIGAIAIGYDAEPAVRDLRSRRRIGVDLRGSALVICQPGRGRTRTGRSAEAMCITLACDGLAEAVGFLRAILD